VKNSAAWRAGAWWSVIACGVVLLWSGAAVANGKFPEAGQIVVDPTNPQQLVAQTTFGLLTTADAGANWGLICENAMGYENIEPPIAISGDGRIFAALYEGLTVSYDDGCGWSKAAGSVSELYAVDVSLKDPDTPVIITVESEAARTRYWHLSAESGSWEQLGVDLPAGFIGLTLDVDPTNASRIYVSGLAGAEQVGALAFSDDDGQTWEIRPIAGSTQATPPFIAGMHPTNGDALFVRTANIPGKLLYTTDAGLTWQEVFVSRGTMRSFAISPDGSQVLAGGELDGVWRAQVADLEFQQVSDFLPMCLKWTENGVYACGHIFLTDGIAIAHSTDAGENFESMLCMADVEGPLDCDRDSDVGMLCPAQWEQIEESLASAACGPMSNTTSSSASGAVGSSSASGTAPTEPPTSPGCGCRVAFRQARGLKNAAMIFMGLLGCVAIVRRRRCR